MNLLAPISTIMTSKVTTVSPDEPLTTIKAIFDERKFHHIPVTKDKKMVGLISKQDFLYFLHGFIDKKDGVNVLGLDALNTAKAEDIMTKGLASLEPDSRINVALEIFKENLFHALPVVDKNGNLAGIITTYDIIRRLSHDPVTLKDYKQ